MSTIDLGLLLNGLDRRARRTAGSADSSPAPLRVVLMEGEALRLPVARTRVTVLTGTAWITQCGMDKILAAGEGMTSAAGADCAVVSALGTVPLLLEVR
jgi:hypothetical protein